MCDFQQLRPPTNQKHAYMTVRPVRFIDPCPPNQIKFPRMNKIRVFPDPASNSGSHLYGCHPLNGNAGPLRRQINLPAAINSLLLRCRTAPTVSRMPVDYDPQVFSEGVCVMSQHRLASEANLDITLCRFSSTAKRHCMGNSQSIWETLFGN